MKILYEIADDSYVTIELYDLNGKKVSNIFSGKKAKGKYNSQLAIGQLSKGMYTCLLISKSAKVMTGKVFQY